MLLISNLNNAMYTYTWHQTNIAPTSEIQVALTLQQWENGYIPKWYPLIYPEVAPNMWFRWERRVLTTFMWLENPSDINHDGKIDLHDFGIIAKYHRNQ